MQKQLISWKTEKLPTYPRSSVAMSLVNARSALYATLSKSHEVAYNQPHFRNILSTLKELMMSTSATSFVGKTRTANGGPLSQSRVSASCSKTALIQVHQTQSHVPIASVVKVCEYFLLKMKMV